MADDLSNAEPVSRLTGLIGAVAMRGSWMEFGLHQLHETLADGPGRELHRRVASADALIEQCKDMVRASQLPTDVVTAGLDALTAASQANRSRNRVVHGIWVVHNDGTMTNAQIRRSGMEENHFTAEGILDILRLLARAALRLDGLQGCSFFWQALMRGRRFPDHDEQMANNGALLRGEFDLSGVHAYRLHRRGQDDEPAVP